MGVDGALEFNGGLRHSKPGINWGMPLSPGSLFSFDLIGEESY